MRRSLFATGLMIATVGCVLPVSQGEFPAPRSSQQPGSAAGGSGQGTSVQPTPAPGQAGDGSPAVPTGPGNLALVADFNPSPASMSVQALPQDFDRATYLVSGPPLASPREGRLAVEGATGKGTALLVDLPPETYTVLVRAFDATGLEIASESAAVSVPAATTATASLLVRYTAGIDLALPLPSGDPPTPSFQVSAP